MTALSLLAAPARAALRWLEDPLYAGQGGKGRRTPTRARAIAARRERRRKAERARLGRGAR